ncbi:hypothetical protein PV682_14230 [Streptomyces niveiscabiei]|uniref:hypothetical protein n=1 Tax=Streptomyces niveiscabiei TaxID=164115 RepID=UPI0029AFB3EA|nr:hypothetical protein [Streptomyces niveiscabiei]MDX3382615.1 hypothetical protein [Streptomyces niveiscabiei]
MPQNRPTRRGGPRLKDFLLVGAPLAAGFLLVSNPWVRLGFVPVAVMAGAALGSARAPKPDCPTPSGTFYEFDAEKLSRWCDSAQLRAAAPHVRHLLVLRTTKEATVKCLLLIESDTNSALLEFAAPVPAVAALRKAAEEDQQPLMRRFAKARLLPASPD